MMIVRVARAHAFPPAQVAGLEVPVASGGEYVSSCRDGTKKGAAQEEQICDVPRDTRQLAYVGNGGLGRVVEPVGALGEKFAGRAVVRREVVARLNGMSAHEQCCDENEAAGSHSTTFPKMRARARLPLCALLTLTRAACQCRPSLGEGWLARNSVGEVHQVLRLRPTSETELPEVSPDN